MFAQAMNYILPTTWNGAVSLETPDKTKVYDGRTSLFFKGVRGLERVKLYEYISKSASEDITDTFLLAFNLRDPRDGKGERDIGRQILVWLFYNYIEKFEKVYKLIPEYGRWDDLLCFFPNYIETFGLGEINDQQKILQDKIIQFISEQILSDYNSMINGNSVTLCAKWVPSEGDSDDKKYHLVETLVQTMNISKKDYRTKYISPLRTYLKIVEKYMCEKRWDEIEFSKVPSCAMKKLKKAFIKNAAESFASWQQKLQKGEVKINAKVLFPHEVIREIRKNNSVADIICEEQWKVLEKEVEKLGNFDKTLVVVDTSGSMESNNYLPLDMATALGLLISNNVQGEFHNHVITFHESPSFQVLKNGNLESRYKQLRNIPWGGSTNLQGVFDLILNKAKLAKLKESEMPDKIFIISDMQFNEVEGWHGQKTNFEVVDEKYKLSGYKRPKIIFWNVNGLSTDFPVSVQDDGTCLISGATTSIISSILNTTEFSSYGIMRTELDKKRYHIIRDSLIN